MSWCYYDGPIRPEDRSPGAVGDLHTAAHEANLFDIRAKYGDVVDAEQVLDWFGGSGRAP